MPAHARLLTLAARGLLAITLILVLAGGAGLVVLHARGQRLLSVQSASMVPVFRPGDALIVEPVPARKLRVGQVVSYRSQLNPQLVISHRLIKIDQYTGWLTTQGDALHSADQPFPPDRLVGRALAVAPNLGYVLNFIRRPLGLLLVVYLPALSLVIIELRQLQTSFKPSFYKAYNCTG